MEECAEIIQRAWREAAGEASRRALGARFFEDSEEEEQDEAVREIQAAWRAPPAPKKASPKRRLMVICTLLSNWGGDECSQAYAAVALQRLTLERHCEARRG